MTPSRQEQSPHASVKSGFIRESQDLARAPRGEFHTCPSCGGRADNGNGMRYCKSCVSDDSDYLYQGAMR